MLIAYYHWVVRERNSTIYCGEYCKRKCSKYSSLIWTNWNSDWERSGPSWIMSLLRQPFVSGVVNGSRSVTHVLHTFFHNIHTCGNQLNSNLANLETTVKVGQVFKFHTVMWRHCSGGNVYTVLWRICSGNFAPISSELPELYRRDYRKHFGLFFSKHTVDILWVLVTFSLLFQITSVYDFQINK